MGNTSGLPVGSIEESMKLRGGLNFRRSHQSRIPLLSFLELAYGLELRACGSWALLGSVGLFERPQQ